MKNELGMLGYYMRKGLTRNFEPNPFLYNTPAFPNLIHSTYNHLPMKMEQTECSET